MVKVMAFGSFDLFHRGHSEYLKQAKKLGDSLVVVVSRDVNIVKFKGRKAIYPEEERLKRVSMSEYVDKAFLGHVKDIFQSVVDEKPDVICLGYDQFMDEKELVVELMKRGLSGFKIVRAKPFNPEVYKSSKLKK